MLSKPFVSQTAVWFLYSMLNFRKKVTLIALQTVTASVYVIVNMDRALQ